MAWMSFADRRGRGWCVDLDRVSQILYSEVFSYEKKRRATRVEEDNGIYPDTVRIEIDYHNMRSVVRARATREYQRFVDTLSNDGSAAYAMLVTARTQAVESDAYVRRRQRRAASETAQNLNRAVRTAETGLAVARFIRDTSASVLIIGSTVIPGATPALVALTGGSLLQGYGTYQDTGNVGAAVIQASTSFVFGLVPLGFTSLAGRTARELAAAESRALFVVGVHNAFFSNSVVSLALGEDVKPAIIGAATNAGLGGVVEVVGGDFFNSLAVPVRVAAQHAAGLGTGAASSAITEAAVGSVQRQIAPISGRISPSCAVVDARHQDYVQLFAMNSVRDDLLPPSRQEFLRALRES